MDDYPDKTIEITVSGKNEGTSAPWWIIIDPGQNFAKNDDGICNIAYMITGPFFSRAEAEFILKIKRHHYSRHAKVWCHSGLDTIQYAERVKF